MGLEVATQIWELNPNNPDGAADPKSQGDDHLRMIKQCILNTFPNINGVITASHSELNVLDGITATTTELNYVDGVTSNIQTQLNSKLATNGNGSALTNLNASALTSGSIPNARVPASAVTQHANAVAAAVTGGVAMQASARNISGKTGTTKTLSNAAPSGGSDGDIWYRY